MNPPGTLGWRGGGGLEKSTSSFAFWEEKEASPGRVGVAANAERSQYNPVVKARELGRVRGERGSQRSLLQESADIDSILNGRDASGREQQR